MSAIHPILHGIIDQLGPDVSDSTTMKHFTEVVSSEISERFELNSLHSAHPMLLTAIMDPRFKNLTLSKYSETEQEAIKKSILELMEMYKDETESPEPVVKRPKKLTALDKLLGEETTVTEPSFSLELDNTQMG